MPILANNFKPNYFFRNGHVNTIAPNVVRNVRSVPYSRMRLETPDNDFLDIDTIINNRNTAIVLLHGLEGNSERPYIKGMAKMAMANKWDVFAVNHRGCSGEANRLLTAYHSGKTEDLDWVLGYLQLAYSYENVVVVGFSLGGNLVLKYAGEYTLTMPDFVKTFVAVSVPCHLASSAKKLKEGFNMVYMARFMKTLKAKAFQKLALFPDAPFSKNDVTKAKTFHDFDAFYTGPVHGFRDAKDYWEKCSSLYFIDKIELPTLLINAADDPFLSKMCYPIDQAKRNENFFLDMPKYGGHVGFVKGFNMKKLYSENRVESFIKNIVK